MYSGEDLRNTYVLAKNKVEILAVRRIKFIKNGRWKLAEKMKEQFNTALPTNKDLFDKYMQVLSMYLYSSAFKCNKGRLKSCPSYHWCD